MKTKEKQGITLIALVITIIVLLILAGVSIAVLTGDNGTITKAVEGKFKTELAEAREEFELYVTKKYAENSRFEEGTLNAGKGFLTYNTMPEGETGNIYDVLKNTPKKYAKCFEIIKGELIYANTNEQQLEWALELGMKINPYLIDENGTLLSSNTNLMLIDENTGTVVLPESVKSIGEGAFGLVEGVRKVIIPSTVKVIQKNAFRNCTSIEEVVFETKVENGKEVGTEEIGESAFYGCKNLKTIKMPNTVITAGQYAFVGCTNLSDVTISNKLKNMNFQLFCNCSNIKEIKIPESVTLIESEVFAGCTQLQKINIPKNLTTIVGNAFGACGKLNNIEIDEENNSFSFSDNILFNKQKTRMIYILPIVSGQKIFTVPSTVNTLDTGMLNHLSRNNKSSNTSECNKYRC